MDSSIYTGFARCRTNMLSVIRNGLWRPDFILTDGQFLYGKISNAGLMRRDMIVETADGSWLIRPKSLLSREAQIFDTSNSENIGKTSRQTWNNRVDLEMTEGFNAVFYKKGIFSRSYYWADNNLLDLITVKDQFTYSTPFAVTIDPSAINAKINIPLITLLGVQLILQKQSQTAAH